MITTYRLIIKGSVAEATNAAIDHGITLRQSWKHDNETHAYADVGDPQLIASWFCEPPLHAPFPVGTLLHYNS